MFFYVYRPLTGKNAKGITDGLADFRRELALVRKYDNTAVSPRNEGFYLSEGGFVGFRLNSFITSYKINIITTNVGCTLNRLMNC